MSKLLTQEQVQKLYDMHTPEHYDLWIHEIHSIKDFAKHQSIYPDGLIYYTAIAAYHLGFKRGKSYQKRHSKRKAQLAAPVT